MSDLRLRPSLNSQLSTLNPAALACLLLACLLQPAFAQRDLKDIPPTDPELERKSFEVAEGFEVNLFAADPKIAKPIQMNFDPQGRLWLATSEVYPHIKPGQKANDKILILEDTDGDGQSDKTHVFADGLLIPTGVAPGDGGAYVANSTELLHFADTDNDGKSDAQRVVLSGFGTEDTHHILHTLRWGPDGCLYMNQSIYIHSHIETPYGVRRLNAGGIWRFRPETMRLEVFARGWVNAWGHQFDRFGQSFVTDGAGGEGINYLLPGASYVTAFGTPRILPGLNPGSPKYCGLEIVGGSHLPDDWEGNLITNDFRGHRVCRFTVSDDGAGFSSQQQPDLIRTRHVAFRPIDVAMGPDGAIYIADWYNPIIQHGEVDFRDPRRDHTHGRIWRVTKKGSPLVPRPQLVKATVPQLIDKLRSREQWTRRQARRVLKERGAAAVLPHLNEALEVATQVPFRLEMLWVYQSLGQRNTKLLQGLLLDAEHQQIRAAAARVAGQWIQTQPDEQLKQLLAKAINDSKPRVRLEAMRALAEVKDGPNVIVHALRALEHPMDRWLEYALWLTCRETSPQWLSLLREGKFDFGGNTRGLAFAIKATGATDVVSSLTRQLDDRKLAGDRKRDVLNIIAELGTAEDLQVVLTHALQSATPPERKVELLNRLANSARSRKVKPAGDLLQLRSLLAAGEPQLQAAAVNCTGAWKAEPLRGQVTKLATSTDTNPALRQHAVNALVELGGPFSRKELRQLADAKHTTQARRMAVVGLAKLDPRTAAKLMVDLLADKSSSDADPAPLFSAFLTQKNGPAALTTALANSQLPGDTARIGLRLADASGRDVTALNEALAKAGGISGQPRTFTKGELASIVADVKQHGDAARGEAVFRRKDLSCFKCHAIGGAGGKVGPDIISLGASAQVDYLLQSLVDPNAKIKENYNSLIIATDGGQVITGVKVRQTDAELILRDAEDKEIRVPLNSILQQKDGKSLMPAGLTDKLTRNEMVNLVRFLSELGKVGRFAVGRENIARRWRVMAATPEAAFRLRRTSYDTAATDDPAFIWEPAYSTVGGELPLESIPPVRVRGNQTGVAFARCDLDVTTGGTGVLTLNSAEGVTAWLNRKPLKPGEAVTLNVPEGKHRLTFAVDLSQRKSGLRVGLRPTDGSSLKTQFVTGK